MAVSFPSSPTTGDIYTYNNKSWQYNGEGWVSYPYQNDGAIANAARDANVNRAVACREQNAVVNAAAVVNQINTPGYGTSTASSLNEYICDMWKCAASLTTNTTYCGHASGTPGGGYGSYLYMAAGSSVPTFGTATDYLLLNHPIEGYRMARYAWGTSGARSIRVGFWVYGPNTGTYAVALQNSSSARHYVIEYTLDAADTWEWKEALVPGDTSGTWDVTNGIGLQLWLMGGAGTNYDTTAETWGAGNKCSTTNCTSPFTTAADALLFTGISVIPGELEFPDLTTGLGSPGSLMMRTWDEEYDLCRRYYLYTQVSCRWTATAASNYQNTTIHWKPMRATPTASISGGSENNISSTGFGVHEATSGRYECVSTGSGDTYSLAKELRLDARL